MQVRLLLSIGFCGFVVHRFNLGKILGGVAAVEAYLSLRADVSYLVKDHCPDLWPEYRHLISANSWVP
jgi:hypothetical protein